ncbi:hypothetical protein DE146DRAFT_615272 [Phaeosphaeria sp. MPI-PUGE-AT-0046c]|nr:hypothetical protein DE146DRAFT_615272 [Phaeosphaeria sp. MPI-PUGE-AT-0046c]
MPLPKRQTIPTKSAAPSSAEDARFANFGSDPKFRLPSKKHTKAKLDPRFARIRTDPDFYNKATVDKYGRKVAKDEGKKAIDRLYQAEDDQDEDEDDNEEEEPPAGQRRDKAVARELARVQKQGFDPIRDGGLESSSDESSSDEDEQDIADETELAGENNAVPTGDISSRLAAVNMDWDNMRAIDIMGVANSFVPAGGRILNVIIYPSDFGMERLQREEIEGPPREIFASSSKSKDDTNALDDLSEASDSEDEQPTEDFRDEDVGEEFDSTALRNYQLDRLRYYYAVITCSSANVAKCIYDNLDGREYLTSANFFDLRFVPDGTTFDQDPHDECEKLPDGYKPNEFSTDALTHSKVKLTWDADDTTRKEVQKRAFSRKEIDENELKAYLGSDSSSSEDEVEVAKADKASKLREALGLSTTSKAAKPKQKASAKRDRDFPKPDGEMEITFTGGLLNNSSKGSVFENEIPIHETTMEKYVRKEKERKARRKERAKVKKEGLDPDAEEGEPAAGNGDEEDPFNDPFFASDPEDMERAEKAERAESKKSKKAKKRKEEEQEAEDTAAERANLELLMAGEDDAKMRHFDMKEIAKAEKAKKKGKKAKNTAPVVEDNFQINTTDPRFAKLYESHEFAIDPTNPKFKDTTGMKALLEEGRKKRKQVNADDELDHKPQSKKSKKGQDAGDEDVKKLAARIKAKSKQSIALYDGICGNGADPDIARLGVVLSFVIASAMTTSASILAMLLDQVFDSKGHFTLRAPIKFIRERFLETEWKKDYAWRPFLDPMIIGFGDQQLITGYAVLLSGWIKVVGQNAIEVQGAHFVLILYICALSSSSHLAALITLRKYFHRYKLIAKIRLALVIVFATFLFSSMIAAICMPPTAVEHDDGTKERQNRTQRLSFTVPLFLIVVGFSTALVCILHDPKRKGIVSRSNDIARNATDPRQSVLPPLDIRAPAYVSRHILCHLFLNPLIAFGVQILLAILSVILVLTQKFSPPKDPTQFCGLQDEEENVWGFGQTLSVVMLLLPAMTACQTYLEGRQEISEGFTMSKN